MSHLRQDVRPEIPDQYECGPVRFSGDENASYERHLVFDHAIEPELATDRERFEALPFTRLCGREAGTSFANTGAYRRSMRKKSRTKHQMQRRNFMVGRFRQESPIAHLVAKLAL